jgi:oxazoline/thiazoline dehydrogenase
VTETSDSLTVCLRPGLRLAEDAAGLAVVTGETELLRLAQPESAVSQAFVWLAGGQMREAELSAAVLRRSGMGALTMWICEYQRAQRLGLTAYAALDGNGRRFATCVPLTRQFRFAPSAEPVEPFVLSRFAFCRQAGGEMVLETPLGHASVILHDPRAALLIAALAQRSNAASLAAVVPDLPSAAVSNFIDILRNARALAHCGPNGEELPDALAQWSFHDLLFHSRSRAGRHNNPTGGLFRHAARTAPAPVTKPVPESLPRVPLFRPDLGELSRQDGRLTDVMERRRSIRTYDPDHPLDVKELGEFLYRTARIRGIRDMQVPGHPGKTFQISSRPYPSGGAMYEVEIYVGASRCRGLESGFYHYDPLSHELAKLRDHDSCCEAMLEFARANAGIRTGPDVLLTMASRFARMNWKYESIAYSATLKNVGSLYQTMYLVAASMNLAPCALGNGNSDLFAAAAGTDYLEEGSIGEFMLGRPAPGASD